MDGVKISKQSSKQAGINGAYIESLVLGISSNPTKLIDDDENKTEIKSCQHCIYYLRKNKEVKRSGAFKINIEQHKHLLEISGFYLFIVHDVIFKRIVYFKVVKASRIEKQFKFLDRVITKHHYYNLNWKTLKNFLNDS